MPPRTLRLRTARLVLRPFEPADAARMVEIQSNWNVTRMLRLAPWPPSLDAMTAWVDLHGSEWAAGEAYRFAVTLDGQIIGAADIDDIADESADLGYWFDEPWWGGGYATEAAQAVIAFAFDQLGLSRITAGHAADNPASGKVLTKLGFRLLHEGERYSGPRGEMIPYRFLSLDRP
jgi:[ribosomal protein S5]-alanine N-acetyltransferase